MGEPTPGRDRPLLECLHVTSRQADDFLILDVVSLDVRAGEIVCLLGAAGAGKTAVLHTFLGLLRPTSGLARVQGLMPATDPIGARRCITYIPRGASMYGVLSARRNLEFFVRVDGGGRDLTRHDYYEAMRRAGLPERSFERPVREIGRTSQLLLWIAVGLLKNSPILLIDEPTAGLDLHASLRLQDMLLELRARGKAILIGTSDVLFAGRIATRIVVMKEGRRAGELTQAQLVASQLQDLYLEYTGQPIPQTGGQPPPARR
jgi:ABC-2 type transport system ATP-binding protein